MQSLEDFIDSDEFGSGKISGYIYGAGLIGRIPRKSVLQPEFPQCLDYLRRTQLPNGSWGSKYPFLVFDRIISTLSAIICLKFWNYPGDKTLIENGCYYLRCNLDKLEMPNDYITVGFELLLLTLLDEAKELGISINSRVIASNSKVIAVCKKERADKISKIENCQKSIKDLKRKAWLYTLEGIGEKYSNDEIKSMIPYNGIICGSYGATAYALLRGIENERGYIEIRKTIHENRGGVPTQKKLDIFDLSWSLKMLYLSGYPLNSNLATIHLDKLEKIWIQHKGMVGGSIDGLPPDSDDISSSLSVLTLAGRLGSSNDIITLLTFFQGDYFVTYEAERTPSISTNAHCLFALAHYQQYPNIVDMSNKVLKWIKNHIIANDYKFQDKWHISRYYLMNELIFALTYFDKELTSHIFNMLIEEQNIDGGWGINRQSSQLETSYSVITILYCLRTSIIREDDKCSGCLIKAKLFLGNNIAEENHQFWIDKILYSMVSLDKLSILCARYAIRNFT